MNRVTRNARRKTSQAHGAAVRPARRSRWTSWASLLTVAVLSIAGILFSQGPADEVAAQTPAKGKKTGAQVATPIGKIPGAGTKLDAAALARTIDQEITRRLAAEGVKSSPLTDDAEFLRRIYLDLVGVIPPAEKVASFLDSKDADKRTKLVDELLADPRFGRWLAENWTTAMLPRESNNRALRPAPLHDWLAGAFNSNKPWDKTVYDLLTATGDQDKNGAVTYFVGNNTVDKITDSVTKLFMGVRLECAQCHNHPFTTYKQTEYWGMAQFFMKVRLTANPQQAAKKGISPGIIESDAKFGKKKGLPESAKIVPAKFLQDQAPKLDRTQPYRPVLAKWMTSPENPFFAKAMANKLWAHFFGRGIVNPVDDMHDGNPATYPELLAAMSEQFKRSGFDVKYLVRSIVNSQTYQRTSRTLPDNETDTELFSHAQVRVLSPEQLYDSFTTIVGKPGRGIAAPKKGAGGKKGPNGPREQFVNFFRVEEGADPLEYQAGIPQALRLMNSALLNNINPLVAQAGKAGGSNPERAVEYLYMAILARRPTAEELPRRVAFVRQQPTAQGAYGDLAWALLNSSEFALNH